MMPIKNGYAQRPLLKPVELSIARSRNYMPQ
jgi:hypothetical protein